MDERIRLSRGSFDLQTGQSQRIEGTPIDVPVPRKVIVSIAGSELHAMRKMPLFERLSQKIQGKALENVFCLRKTYAFDCINRNSLVPLSSGYIIALCPQRFDRFEFEILL
jgi:hypothetical protein